MKTLNDDKSEGVKFYELDDEEEILSNGNDPVPQVTMPTFKKRVHSQRIPQSERAAVTPYEGAYDEKYSSDEENIEYEVCEPEDPTERSNSTITFSEDIYDSDAIDEMLRNQIRKPSQVSQEGSVKSEDLTDGSKPSRGILKGKGSKKGDGFAPSPSTFSDKSPPASESKVEDKTVSSAEKIATAGDAIISESTTSGKNMKSKKGEEILENITKSLQSVITDTVTDKESSVKGEREIITKPLQSTIPQQIDQITDSSATNKHDFAKSDEKVVVSVTKPLQDTLSTHSAILTEAALSTESFPPNTLTGDLPTKMADVKPPVAEEASPKDAHFEPPPKKADLFRTEDFSSSKGKTPDQTLRDVSPGIEKPSGRISFDPDDGVLDATDRNKDDQKKYSKDAKVTSISIKEEISKGETSPTREYATKRAMELINDITKTVEDVFPTIATETSASTQLENRFRDAFGGAIGISDAKKIDNGETAQAKDKKLSEQSGSTFGTLKPSAKDGSEAGVEKGGRKIKDSDTSKAEPTEAMQDPESTLKSKEATEKISEDATPFSRETQLASKDRDFKNERAQPSAATDASVSKKEFTPEVVKVGNGVAKQVKGAETVTPLVENVERLEQLLGRTECSTESVKSLEKEHTKDSQADTGITPSITERIGSVDVNVMKGSDAVDILTSEDSDPKKSTYRTNANKLSPDISLSLDKTTEIKLLDKTDEPEKAQEVHPEQKLQKDNMSEMTATGTTGDAAEGRQPIKDESSDQESKPRVIFRIDSEDELQSDADNELTLPPSSDPSSPTGKLTEKMKRELKEALEKEQIKLEERLSSLKGSIFDISDESLLKTKEMVDKRLRKISDIKPPQEMDEAVKKEKSPEPNKEVKIGRFHITPALVEEVINKNREHEIAERLKTTRTGDEAHEEIEKELPEKLTEADLEEVIRELKKEGLKTDVYLQPEEVEKEEKKERTLKRVERRFERMASETLEKDKEEGISEEKLNEKREIEFQRMVSNLSSDEVAEYQKEYLQLWDEGGLSSLTPTEDWESRDPDTPENELEDDSPRKSESFQGSHGTGKPGTPIKSSEPKKFLKSPISPPKSSKLSDDVSPKTQPLTPVDVSHVGSSPSEVDHSSGFVSERSDDIPTYSERKKFWEQMSSSQSSENAGELQRSLIESVSSAEFVEVDKTKEIDESDKTSVETFKQKFETVMPEIQKTPEEGSVVKSLTESYSKKIAAGELIMPAVPRPKSTSFSTQGTELETEQSNLHKVPDSSDMAVVSELEVKLKSRDSGAPITETTVVSGSTKLEEHSDKTSAEISKKSETEMSAQESMDSEAEFIAKFGVESVAYDNKVFTEDEIGLPLKERKKVFEESLQDRSSLVIPIRKTKEERSMSLPAVESPSSIKMQKKYFEEEMKKETVTEKILGRKEQFHIETKKTEISQIEDVANIGLLSKGIKIVQEKLHRKEPAVAEPIAPKTLITKETHLEKSETEGSEKEKSATVQKPSKKEEELIPSITITSGKRQPETASIGESEDTQSESDITPEEARVVDNGDTQWDGSGTHSGGFSPKDDMDYPKEILETGIGRWLGQEDLSKQNWEKDDLDSSHFKMHTKWERTRSEGASPKDHYVCTPEEHYPDTVWEVPVQEQLEKEEITHDIPIEKQVIIEKDEDELDEEEEVKVKLTEEEAKDIAEEVLEYIQFEVENRSSFLTNETEEIPKGLAQAQVSDYLHHLTAGKDFDDQDVKMIENILVKKQRERLWKSQSGETSVCSVDITDEELRSTGAEEDISPVESQITKLQKRDFPDMTAEGKEDITVKETDDSQTLKDVEIVDKTLAEVKESLEAAQEQLIEQHKRRTKSEILRKESLTEFELKGTSFNRKLTEVALEQSSDFKSEVETHKIEKQEKAHDVKHSEAEGHEKKLSKESLKEEILIKKSSEELLYSESDKEKLLQKSFKDSTEEEKQSSHQIKSTADIFQSEDKFKGESDFDENIKTLKVSKQVEIEGKKFEQTNKKEQQIQAKEISEKERIITSNEQRIQTSTIEETSAKKVLESAKLETKTTTDITPAATVSSRLSEISKTESKIQKAIITESKMDVEELKTLEISVPEKMVIQKIGEQIFSSEDSPRSGSLEESMRSPPIGEEIFSSGSSVDKQGDNKSGVLYRHSSSSSFLKADRRSGADLEPYSSSGESHYHSFEQPPSRPCSSDVEMLLTGNAPTTGSSEYESAVSQEISGKQQTSTEYQTAVSSLSSRESMRSLDSESSGHLGSVEVSSEASETLIPSALELDRDVEASGTTLLDDEGATLVLKDRQRAAHRNEAATFITSARSADEDFEIISESEVASLGGEASEDEEGVPPVGQEAKELALKMKRSYEMTFQPEPKPIAFLENSDILPKDESCSTVSAPDEKFGSSLEESGSVLSMSLSTTSEPSAMRTVIELSHTDSEKMEGSLTVSATSIDSASRDDLDKITSQPSSLTNEMSTSTAVPGSRKPTASVTITTSSSEVHGVPCVSTQVTSVSRKSSMVDEVKSESDSHEDDSKGSNLAHTNGPTQVEYVPDYDEIESTKTKKTQGHRRKESTSNFVPTMMWNMSEARTLKLKTDITEIDEEYSGDKYAYDLSLTEKEVKNDEKKEADDSESHDQEFEGQDRKVSEGEDVEEFKDYDNNRPQSQTSRTDSDSGRRHMSSVFSEDQPDSELSDLMKQGSSETEREDPLERPLSPEPEDMENKDITPEFSSEAQASVTELEMEYSGAYSRRDEYASHVSPIREEKSDTRFKEPISEEYLEENRVPDGLRSQTSLESTVAEKHELETGEKEILQKKPDLPDITVTEHKTPVSSRKFQYPGSKEEPKEKKSASKTPDTPASTSSRTSSSSDQGKEYNLDEVEIRKISGEMASEEKGVSETKDEKDSMDSPSSDSFEMLDKPDIADEFVIIEEVGREAQENDQEGKSIKIASRDQKSAKRTRSEQEVIMSPPSPATKMTDLKYYPSEEDPDLFLLDSDSPPQATTRKFAEKLKRRPSKEEKLEEFEQQIEQSKKWVEMQFQGEQAAKIMGAYGYEMEFERAPLEDIKEEDLNELDSSSKMGSMGSQKESLGSFGSVKDSFSSTPDFDVLAGRKYFTRSGEHDDVSMSSLQEFELIEKKLMENGKKSGSSSSQDSLNSKKLGTSSKSGQGDDISTGSLKEFETLENACATVVNMEKKAKQEEAILSEIDEGHESQISESESCETVSAVMKEKLEFDSEDFDKKMFEIDEIIRQAQSNVEKFSEMQALEKIESIGRGDSYEEVAKVPDLELDMPFSGKLMTEASNLKSAKSGYSTSYLTQLTTKKKDEWKTVEKAEQQKVTIAKQSELLENGGKIKSISADSLEIQTQEKKIILEGKEETISLDSYKRKSQKSDACGFVEMSHKSDSMEEVRHHDSSSGEYTSSGTEHRPPPRAEFILGSTDSLDPSSSTATHATYQYETDSVMSSSFTSGDSNTMISSTDNLDMLVSGQSVIDLSKDPGISKTDDWLENLEVGGVDPLQKQLFAPRAKSEVQKVEFRGPNAEKMFQEYVQGLDPKEEVMEEVDEHGNVHLKKVLKQRVVIRTANSKSENLTTVQHEKVSMGSSEPFVSEIVETLKDDDYSHVVHKKIQMAPEVEKITFRGPDAEEALKSYIENLPAGEEIQETEEVDEHGNLIRKKIIRERVLVRSGERSQTQHDAQKITFQERDPEKVVENLRTVVPEAKDVGEDKSVYIKRLEEKKITSTDEFNPEKEGSYKKPVPDQVQIIDIGPQMQKIIIRGPNAEKTLEEYAKSLNPEDDVLEMEEVDEQGNFHLKKVLRQRILVRPQKELTKEELQQYLRHLVESEPLQGEEYSHVVQKNLPTDIQKVTFKGPDAEEKFQEFIRQQQEQPEIEEIEEVDEHGNVHIKKVIKQRVIIRQRPAAEVLSGMKTSKVGEKQSRMLTKEELEEYLNRLEEPEPGEGFTRVTQANANVPAEVQKVVFKGPDAEKQLQEFIRQQQEQPEVEEIEEVDEHGNVHIKKVIKQRVVIRQRPAAEILSGMKTSDGGEKQGRMLTKEELEEYLNRLEEPEPGEGFTRVTQANANVPAEVQKVVFKGPDAEKQLQEFIRQQQEQPEVEEIEEVDEHGNVHIKKIIKQRVVIRQRQAAEVLSGMKTSDGGDKQSRMLTKEELEQYLDQLEQSESGSSISFRRVGERERGDIENTTVESKLAQQHELSERLLTEEEFQERLRLRPTTMHVKDINIGITEPLVSEVIEPLNEEGFSHVIHKEVQMVPEVQKVMFRGPDADKAMKAYLETLAPGEDIEEIEEVDDCGNVHVQRIVRRKIIIKPEDLEKTGLKGEELKSYLKRLEIEHFEGGEDPHVHPRDPNTSFVPKLTQGFSSSVVLTEKEGRVEEEKAKLESPPLVGKKESGISQRPPLVSDISMDDEAEYDPTEHDWRHQLEILHAEADEEEIDQNLDAALAASFTSQKKQ